MTMSIRVYDPPMCCSTGVCGSTVDPKLVRFAADLEWAQQQGARVERFNLAQQPGAFVAQDVVRQALEEHGNEALPLVLVNDAVVLMGSYPSRQQLASWIGVAAPGETDGARGDDVRRAALDGLIVQVSSCCGGESLLMPGKKKSGCC